MKSQFAFVSLVLIGIIFSAGCNDPLNINEPLSTNNPRTQNFMSIADKSSSVNSFEPNYSDEQAMSLTGSMNKELYPIKIGQKMKLVEKSLTITKDSSSALGTLVQKYDGKLTIEGSFQKPTIGINSRVDTTIHKSFSTSITRLIKFKKISNTGNDTVDWKIEAISLPVGGTLGNEIQIVKMTLTTQDGNNVVIDNPNSYFFQVGNEKKEKDDDDNHEFKIGFGTWGYGWKNLLTWYRKNQPVTLSVEVLSKSADPDLITVSYGASLNSNSKSKDKFNLISSIQQGDMFKKVYERKWYTHSFAARMHAVVNALPRTSAYDTDASVEEKTWGIPYRIK